MVLWWEPMDTNAPTDSDLPVAAAGSTVLNRLTDAQAFSRDPESYTDADLNDTIERLTRIVARQRKARQDDAAITAAAAAIKKTNAAARKAKAKKGAPADPMENKV